MGSSEDAMRDTELIRKVYMEQLDKELSPPSWTEFLTFGLFGAPRTEEELVSHSILIALKREDQELFVKAHRAQQRRDKNRRPAVHLAQRADAFLSACTNGDLGQIGLLLADAIYSTFNDIMVIGDGIVAACANAEYQVAESLVRIFICGCEHPSVSEYILATLAKQGQKESCEWFLGHSSPRKVAWTHMESAIRQEHKANAGDRELILPGLIVKYVKERSFICNKRLLTTAAVEGGLAVARQLVPQFLTFTDLCRDGKTPDEWLRQLFVLGDEAKSDDVLWALCKSGRTRILAETLALRVSTSALEPDWGFLLYLILTRVIPRFVYESFVLVLQAYDGSLQKKTVNWDRLYNIARQKYECRDRLIRLLERRVPMSCPLCRAEDAPRTPDPACPTCAWLEANR